MQSFRPRLTPSIADVRRAVREGFLAAGLTSTAPRSNEGDSRPDGGVGPSERVPTASTPSFDRGTDAGGGDRGPANAGGADGGRSSANADGTQNAGKADVLVALSGGPDSLALAAATAFEAPRAGLRAGAVIVDHGLQAGSADVAARAAQQATELGLEPVTVTRVAVGAEGGPEAGARTVRYEAFHAALTETGARSILLGHTLDDQAETVLLGLARGSGATSLQGMAAQNGPFLRPLLGVRRATTVQFCEDAGLEPWHDPHNSDEGYTRVRVRNTVLPLLETELGPGIAQALARTAEQLREDSDALDHFAEEIAEELADIAEAGISLPVGALAANPAALRQRLIRLAVESEFHVSLSRQHTLEVARLVTDWRGQGPLHLPGIRVERQGALLVFSASTEDDSSAADIEDGDHGIQ